MNTEKHKVCPDKEYENFTNHLRHLNDKIIQVSLSFVQIATAIIGGSFYLKFTYPTESKDYWWPVDLLLICVGVGHIFIILKNLQAWRAYRKKLSEKFDIELPKGSRWCQSEVAMCTLIIVVILGFIYFNPMGRPAIYAALFCLCN
ncbi:MAG: hypothetical protein A2Z83_09340 [Omnitrophica bacterium GWA2_52_8]|nr:MAG: hypothetical protein A2Z83_09340 [Omnitrophica bacterium GWA2_52_8]